MIEPEATRLRQRLENWSGEHFSKIKDADPELPEQLNDRQQDGAEILLALADAVGGEWPARACKSLVELYKGGDAEDQSVHVRLLTDVQSAFDTAGVDKLSSTDLVAALVEMESSPWGEWHHGKPLTPISLARLLRPFKILPKTIRIGTGTSKGYDRDLFMDSWERYLPKNPPDGPLPPIPIVTPSQACVYAVLEQFSGRNSDISVRRSEAEESPIFTPVVTAVTDQKGQNGPAELILPCDVHGRHPDWWIRILPDGGEMTCGKCEPQGGHGFAMPVSRGVV
jgi:putative DNA primase/helicase